MTERGCPLSGNPVHGPTFEEIRSWGMAEFGSPRVAAFSRAVLDLVGGRGSDIALLFRYCRGAGPQAPSVDALDAAAARISVAFPSITVSGPMTIFWRAQRQFPHPYRRP